MTFQYYHVKNRKYHVNNRKNKNKMFKNMLDELYLKDMYIILYVIFSLQVILTLEGIKIYKYYPV